jgi:hypothetical protein
MDTDSLSREVSNKRRQVPHILVLHQMFLQQNSYFPKNELPLRLRHPKNIFQGVFSLSFNAVRTVLSRAKKLVVKIML